MAIDLGALTDDQYNRLCDLCEHHGISYSRNTCEGSHCEQAAPYLEDEDYELESLIIEKFGDKFKELYEQLKLK